VFRTELTAWVGILFVLVGAANVWMMFHRMSPGMSGERGARWAQAHRAGGYLFTALYLVMMYLMVLRLRDAPEELGARGLIHMILALTLAPILFLKILIARSYRTQSQYLTPLGILLFCLSFVLVGMTSGPYMLRRATLETISLESVGLKTEQIDMRQAEGLMRDRCGRCHNLDQVVGARKDAEGWLETVNRMRALPGSGISAEDARTITFYLVKALGVDSSKPTGRHLVGRALVDARCARCHTLDTVWSAKKSPEAWKTTVDRMVKLSPPGHFRPGEAEAILAYLAGPRTHSAAATAPASGGEREPGTGGSSGGGSGGGQGAGSASGAASRASDERNGWLVLAGSLLLCGALYRRGGRRSSPGGALAPVAPASTPAPAAGAAALPRTARVPLTLARIRSETPDVKTFRFTLPPGVELSHQAGQFLTFDWMVDGEKSVRSYSISSAPSRSRHHLEVTVKRVPGGRVSCWLHDHARPGMQVDARPPAGRFVLPEPIPPRLLLIAAGSGVTPVMSLLRALDETCAPVEAALLYCVRTEEEIIFRREIERLQEELPGFRAVITLTQPGETWQGERGRLSREMLLRHMPEQAGLPVYLCGPKPFMEATVALLVECGVARDQIRQEQFGGPPAPRAELSGESVAATAGPRARFARAGTSVAVPEGATLLEVAESHGVAIPYSCRQGQCGTCATRLIRGDVTMDAEEGLDPELRRQGFVLTCVGRARGDVELDA
jgi:ferredoxin-NADP reductase